MNRAISVGVVCCGMLIAVASNSPCEEATELHRNELLVLFVKVVAKVADEREDQVLPETMLPTYPGESTSFLVGANVPHGDTYLDVGQRFDFTPTKVRGKTVWVVIKTSFTDIDKSGKSEWNLLERRIVTKRKMEHGKVVVSDSWKWDHAPQSQMHLEYRIERMTRKEYAIADAKAREGSKRK